MTFPTCDGKRCAIHTGGSESTVRCDADVQRPRRGPGEADRAVAAGVGYRGTQSRRCMRVIESPVHGDVCPGGYTCGMGKRRIAVIGSGQSGLVAAHGLVRAGHDVKVYSDRSADAWLNESRPTGTAARFQPALSYERSLGLAHWEADAPTMRGIHLTFSPKVGNRLLTMAARLPEGGQAVDLRLQSHR